MRKYGVRVGNVASVFEICVNARSDMPSDVKSGTLSRIGAYARFHASDEMSLDRQNFEKACLKKVVPHGCSRNLPDTV